MNALAKLVKEERKNLALTQMEFAKLIGVTAVSVCQIENGKIMGSTVIKKLSKYFKKQTREIRHLMLKSEEI